MIKTFQKIRPLYFFIDFVIITSIFYLSYIFKYNPPGSINSMLTQIRLPDIKEYSFVFMLWLIFIATSFRKGSLYTTDRKLTIPTEVLKVLVSLFYTGILMSAVIFFAQYKFFSREIFLESFFLLCIFLSGWRVAKRLVLRKLIAYGFHNINILIVGAGKIAGVISEEIKRNPQWGFNVLGFLDDNGNGDINGFPILGKLKDCIEVIKRHFVDEIIVTIPSAREAVSELISQAKKMGLGLKVVPENFEEPLLSLDVAYLGVVPLLTYKERKHHPTEFALKRLLDFLAALVLLIILSPLFIIIAILIKLDSAGPVFYIQERVGFKGKRFRFYKFRSMIKDADKLKPKLLEKNEVKDGVIFKIKDDPRITRVGKFLRRHSLDELPQLCNALKGDMNLVGPRPPILDEVEKYNHTHMQRLSIRPGMTCLSQVKGRSDLTFRKWAKLDLWYINNWSFGLDFRILWWTMQVVLKGKGAY